MSETLDILSVVAVIGLAFGYLAYRKIKNRGKVGCGCSSCDESCGCSSGGTCCGTDLKDLR